MFRFVATAVVVAALPLVSVSQAAAPVDDRVENAQEGLAGVHSVNKNVVSSVLKHAPQVPTVSFVVAFH
jgi:hypothetical protein